MKPTPQRKKIGRDLKVLRTVWGKTQQEMADMIGIHQTALSRVENGTQCLTDEELIHLRAKVKKEPNIFWGEI
jgi:DNA-binding XRE family transcriptional regulator